MSGAQPLPRVLVVSLGGTIAMTSSGPGGIRPTLTGEQMLAAEPRLARVAELEAVTPMNLPGASLSLQQLCGVASLV
jgi:L-asparaginase